MLIRPKNDLIEIFGYAPTNLTDQYRSLWRMSACPFVSKQCTKSNHDGSIIYGTCTVSTKYGDCIVCPSRFYEKEYAVLREISGDVFGDNVPFLMYDEYIKQRQSYRACAIALGQNSGKEVKIGTSLSMDWVLAKVESGSLVEYTGIEVQSIDITGNYRDTWHSYDKLTGQCVNIPNSEHGMNWANVHKRLIPQIIRKGTIYSNSDLVKSGLHFVVPDVVYQKFEEILGNDIQSLPKGGKDVLTIRTYELTPFTNHDEQRSLKLKRKILVSLEEFSKRFISGPNLPKGAALDQSVRRVLGVS